jgi:hypothetical protein
VDINERGKSDRRRNVRRESRTMTMTRRRGRRRRRRTTRTMGRIYVRI